MSYSSKKKDVRDFSSKILITKEMLKDKDKLATMLSGLYNDASLVWLPAITEITANVSYLNGDQWNDSYEQYIKNSQIPNCFVNVINRVNIQKAGDLAKTFKRPYFDFPSPQEDPAEDDDSDEAIMKRAYLARTSRATRRLNACVTKFSTSSGLPRTVVEASRIADAQMYGLVQLCFDGCGFYADVIDNYGSVIDPNFTRRSLDDCAYVILMKSATRGELIAQFPDEIEEINKASVVLDMKTLHAVQQPLYSDTVSYREYWLRDSENMISDGKGSVIVIKTLASSGSILSIERPPYSVFPFALVCNVLNKSADKIIDKMPPYISNLMGIQDAINRSILFMIASTTNVMGSTVLFKEEAFNDNNAIAKGFVSGSLAINSAEPIDNVIKRLEPNTAPQSYIAPVQELVDKLMLASGLSNPELGGRGNQEETAALIERKSIEEDTAIYYYKQGILETMEALTRKLAIMMIQCAVDGSLESDKSPNMYDIDNILEDSINGLFTIDSLSTACSEQLEPEDVKDMLFVLLKSTVQHGWSDESPTDKARLWARVKDLGATGFVTIPPELAVRCAGTGFDEQIISYNKRQAKNMQNQQDPNTAKAQRDMAESEKIKAETQEIHQRIGMQGQETQEFMPQDSMNPMGLPQLNEQPMEESPEEMNNPEAMPIETDAVEEQMINPST